ncbi:MAG: alanine dehydrogenase [Nitrospirota bacterium]
MIIGVPKEIKEHEYRVSITPRGVEELKRDGHTILVETEAGSGSGFSDEEYLKADADIVDRRSLFDKSDLIVKVKEPLFSEYSLLKENQALFAYLHLASNKELTGILIEKKITALGYETLEKDGSLPLLTPMSEIAGRMAPIVGAFYLQRVHGGSGRLPSGAVGVRPAKALILGAGVVGFNAARVCIGLGMEVVIMNRGVERLQKVDEVFMGRVRTLPLTRHNIVQELNDSDIIIGAVLVPGGRTPLLIRREDLKIMRRGSVLVDVSVDQGGCAETSRPTTHDNPIYEVDGIIHYAVANMPGAYPRTSTIALTNATLPFIRTIANKGIEETLRNDPVLKSALNTCRGCIVHKALADSTGIECKDIDKMLSR